MAYKIPHPRAPLRSVWGSLPSGGMSEGLCERFCFSLAPQSPQTSLLGFFPSSSKESFRASPPEAMPFEDRPIQSRSLTGHVWTSVTLGQSWGPTTRLPHPSSILFFPGCPCLPESWGRNMENSQLRLSVYFSTQSRLKLRLWVIRLCWKLGSICPSCCLPVVSGGCIGRSRCMDCYYFNCPEFLLFSWWT